MGKKSVQLRRDSQQMYPIIARYENSDQTQADFCETHQINQGVFQYWLKKYRDEHDFKRVDSYAKLEVVELDEDSCPRIIIRTRSGVEIEIPLK